MHIDLQSYVETSVDHQPGITTLGNVLGAGLAGGLAKVLISGSKEQVLTDLSSAAPECRYPCEEQRQRCRFWHGGYGQFVIARFSVVATEVEVAVARYCKVQLPCGRSCDIQLGKKAYASIIVGFQESAVRCKHCENGVKVSANGLCHIGRIRNQAREDPVVE